MWGKNDEPLSSNYEFHFSCLDHILDHYQRQYSGLFKRVCVFSDGCAEQCNSKYFAEELTHLCEHCPWIEECVHT